MLSLSLLILGVVSTGAVSEKITILPDQTCTSSGCHDQFGKAKVVHPAMEDGDCSSCHDQQGDEHTFEYMAEDNDLCSMCHEAFEEKKNQHAALEMGCISCHDPHQSRMNALLKTGSMQELCFTCHDDSMLNVEWPHSPVQMGGCEVCHNPHESDNSGLLNEPLTTLCLMCHPDIDSAFRENRVTHLSAREDCTACHNPHGGQKQLFLKSDVPQLCFECHGDVEATVTNGTFKHTVTVEGKRCLNCHVPHASAHSGLLRQEASQICNLCHSKEMETPEGKIKGIGSQIAGSLYVHSPVGDGDCASCHDPHGSANFRLLTGKYPDQFFAPYSEDTYSLCFTCHEQEMLTYTKTQTLTEFRNGTDNLHFFHVTRMDNPCSVCHDVHASFEKHLIKETSQMGHSIVPMNFKATDTGGSCSPACHDNLKYDRENPVTIE